VIGRNSRSKLSNTETGQEAK